MLDFAIDAWDMQTATAEQIDEWRDAAQCREPPMQVKLTIKGEWHRPLAGRGRTACGKALGGYATRDDSLLGSLCLDGCFAPYEFKLAAEERDRVAAEQRAREIADDLEDEIAGARERRDSQQIHPAKRG